MYDSKSYQEDINKKLASKFTLRNGANEDPRIEKVPVIVLQH
jgi:hypothetical protein